MQCSYSAKISFSVKLSDRGGVPKTGDCLLHFRYSPPKSRARKHDKRSIDLTLSALLLGVWGTCYEGSRYPKYLAWSLIVTVELNLLHHK